MGPKNHPTKEVYGRPNRLRKKFNIGRDTGRKQDPSTVAKEMRRAKDADGNRLFPSSKDFLTSQQIASFFSRLASKNKGALTAEPELDEEAGEDDDDDNDNGDEDENAYSARQEKTMEDMRILATKEIGFSHPIMYDTYNICELLTNGQWRRQIDNWGGKY